MRYTARHLLAFIADLCLAIMKTLIATVLMIFGCISPILAQQISCGDPPKIQSSVEQKLKADAEGKAQLLTKLLGLLAVSSGCGNA
jgi:hypothetical protein